MTKQVRTVMSAGGKLTPDSGAHLHKTQLLEFYRLMVLSRELDLAKVRLHTEGKIGFQVDCRGQESLSIGAGCALAAEDWVFPSWRHLATAIARGVRLESIIDNLFGNERDEAKGRQGPGSAGFFDEKIVPVSAPAGTHIAQAVGMAQGAKIKNQDHVALCLFGAGALESPDFHSGLNFAGVMNAPVVFLTDGTTDVGEAYGLDAEHVDGCDVLATYSVVAAACAKARANNGPTIIHGHMTDKDGGLSRFQTWLNDAQVIDAALAEEIGAQARHEIRVAIANSSAIGFPDEASLFTHVLTEQSTQLKRTARAVQAFRAEYGGSDDPNNDFVLE